MTSDRDIFIVAQLIIDQYGDDAEDHAQSRADDLARKGDEAGRVVWLGVAEAVKLLRQDSGTLH